MEWTHALIAVLVLTNLVTLALLLRGRGAGVRLPSLAEYRVQFPQAIDHKGEIRCHRCSSTSIHMSWKAFNRGINIHTCNHCGTRLYRT